MTENPRSVYKKAEKAFTIVLNDFGVSLNKSDIRKISAFFKSMESVDREVDSLDQNVRQQTIESLIYYIQTGDISFLPQSMSPQTQEDLRQLRELLSEPEAFAKTLEKVFATNEVVRSTTDIHEYIQATLDEGKHTVQLIIDEMHGEISKRATVFLEQSTALTNIFDNMMDAKQDFEKKEMHITPSGKFYFELSRVFFPRIIRVLLSYPNKKNLWLIIRKSLKHCFISPPPQYSSSQGVNGF